MNSSTYSCHADAVDFNVMLYKSVLGTMVGAKACFLEVLLDLPLASEFHRALFMLFQAPLCDCKPTHLFK